VQDCGFVYLTIMPVLVAPLLLLFILSPLSHRFTNATNSLAAASFLRSRFKVQHVRIFTPRHTANDQRGLSARKIAGLFTSQLCLCLLLPDRPAAAPVREHNYACPVLLLTANEQLRKLRWTGNQDNSAHLWHFLVVNGCPAV
jgi:hypothetical protein